MDASLLRTDDAWLEVKDNVSCVDRVAKASNKALVECFIVIGAMMWDRKQTEICYGLLLAWLGSLFSLIYCTDNSLG